MATCIFAIILSLAFESPSTTSLMAQAGGYDHHKGHVHINVWRGPSKGYHKKKFAPWGYYAKLPADESPKHHYKHHY